MKCHNKRYNKNYNNPIQESVLANSFRVCVVLLNWLPSLSFPYILRRTLLLYFPSRLQARIPVRAAHASHFCISLLKSPALFCLSSPFFPLFAQRLFCLISAIPLIHLSPF